jgi:hypothetical protein
MSSILDNHFTTDPEGEYVYFPKLKGFLKKEGAEVKAPEHYDNSKGSLYKWCEERGLNSWEFDIIKRVMRCRKKGQFIEDIDKTIELLKLYKDEFK